MEFLSEIVQMDDDGRLFLSAAIEDQRAESRHLSTARSKPAGTDGDLAGHRVRAANHRRRSSRDAADGTLPLQSRSNSESARPTMDHREQRSEERRVGK